MLSCLPADGLMPTGRHARRIKLVGARLLWKLTRHDFIGFDRMRLNLIAPPVEADAANNNDARKSNRTYAREVMQLTSQFGERALTPDSALFGNDHTTIYIVGFIFSRGAIY